MREDDPVSRSAITILGFPSKFFFFFPIKHGAIEGDLIKGF